jgi:spermidine synthase
MAERTSAADTVDRAETEVIETPATVRDDPHPRARLVVASALLLFVELAMIRWLGANVVHLSYFSNFVLLGSFLGGGLGFMRARGRNLTWTSPILLAALVAFVTFFPVEINQSSSQIIYFTSVKTSGLPIWLTLPVIFILSAAVMAGIGQAVSRFFLVLPALDAYRFDVLGSIIGIVAFTLLSFLRAPSLGWGVIAAIGYVAVMRWRPGLPVFAGLALIIGLLTYETVQPGISWSPYYKVKVQNANNGNTVHINVNGVPHQTIQTVAFRKRHGSVYIKPYKRLPNTGLDNVLIVGAGSGSDVALALSEGAQHIDAVEIDPRIRDIGVSRNPDHPYQDPRVSMHINDGRAFLQQTHAKYNLILFALPDSLTLVSGASSLRLESFLFTKEAMEVARDHLTPNGGFAMYNYYRQRWLVNRYAGTLRDVYGHPPCLDQVGTYGHLDALSIAMDSSQQQCVRTWHAKVANTPAPATDNRPFPYLKTRTIPRIYIIGILGILVASLLGLRLASRSPFRGIRSYTDLFFMGVAFLLLETKNVTGFALLFGTTWIVNAFVFGGVLVAVLAAVEYTRRWRTPPFWVVYVLLLLALAAAWLVPSSSLLAMSYAPRLIAAVALAFAPIFLANVAFAKRLAEVGDATVAFGANLIGAMIGGCVEYTSLAIGYRSLLIVVAVAYAVAFGFYARQRRALAV